jgi:hypothetical protein
MAREPEFKILKNTDGEYYWRLEAADSPGCCPVGATLGPT